MQVGIRSCTDPTIYDRVRVQRAFRSRKTVQDPNHTMTYGASISSAVAINPSAIGRCGKTATVV